MNDKIIKLLKKNNFQVSDSKEKTITIIIDSPAKLKKDADKLLKLFENNGVSFEGATIKIDELPNIRASYYPESGIGILEVFNIKDELLGEKK